MASGRRTSAPPLTPERQLALWVAGKPQCPNTRNECCPDFSCCKPKLLAPLAMRKRFVAASQEEREKMMLGDFLGKFVADVNKKSGTRAMVVGQTGKRR